MDPVRIQFELRPLDQVRPSVDRKRLHWFELTDGWFDLTIGSHRLFESSASTRGAELYVVRPWEDLIDVAPFAFNPLPDPLVARVGAAGWTDWVARAWEASANDYELAERALGWWQRRQLGTSYLHGAPRLDFWRHGEELHVEWSSPPTKPGEPTWVSPGGSAVVSVGEFRDKLVELDRALIAAMGERIDAAAQSWARADVKVDIDELRRDHADRSTWLQKSLDVGSDKLPPWDEILAAIGELEQRVRV